MAGGDGVSWLIAGVCLLAAPAARAHEFDPEAALAWVEHADARELFEREIANGSERFRIVCGISCDTPGVREEEPLICYGRVGREEIAGSSDNPHTPREDMLNHRAHDLALAHNTLLRERADKLLRTRVGNSC